MDCLNLCACYIVYLYCLNIVGTEQAALPHLIQCLCSQAINVV